MNRLQAEFQRLYLPPSTQSPAGGSRALVLELARPADWALLHQVWRGVQSDLALPAPAIAVSGSEGMQLWFSLAEPTDTAQAQAFLFGLCQRYLPDVAAPRLRLMPGVALGATTSATALAPQVPALQASTGNWSAFVAQDLAPLFADTPWLDVPPGDEGQAQLLSGLACIQPPAWAAALARLQPPPAPPAPEPTHELRHERPATASAATAQHRAYAATQDPQHFLQAVMNDDGAPLALRIEAAKALLPYAQTP